MAVASAANGVIDGAAIERVFLTGKSRDGTWTQHLKVVDMDMDMPDEKKERLNELLKPSELTTAVPSVKMSKFVHGRLVAMVAEQLCRQSSQPISSPLIALKTAAVCLRESSASGSVGARTEAVLDVEVTIQMYLADGTPKQQFIRELECNSLHSR
jgi:hypothetical protein